MRPIGLTNIRCTGKGGVLSAGHCKPNQASLVEQHAAKIASACRLIESSETPPSLELLAQHVGLSAYHFHRVFKAQRGLHAKNTPPLIATSLCERRLARVTQ